MFVPTDHKAFYEMIEAGGFPCLIVREAPKPAKRAILYFFGGGMVIGPDRGDLPVMRKESQFGQNGWKERAACGILLGSVMEGRRDPEMNERRIAYYHLPGLFEFYELYRAFLPLFRDHREYFYDWCAIGSVYGAPADCLWGGGRAGFGDCDSRAALELMREYGISARLTFSNSLLREEHLSDGKCNALCRMLAESEGPQNGVIVHSELLLSYLRDRFPQLYFVSSTTKVLTEFAQLRRETERDEFRYVVPDFRLNRALDELSALPQPLKDKLEFLCNECCWFGCRDRKRCYEAVSRKNLGEAGAEHRCAAPDAAGGYRFSRAMENPGFIGVDDIRRVYLPMGFSHFKIEGRSLGSALILEFLLHYLTKPEHQLRVREEIYLDNALDLF